MLAARIQAIGGTGTLTPQDSQPCRLLPPVYASLDISQRPVQNSGPSGALLLSREALASSLPCRFNPAHPDTRSGATIPDSPVPLHRPADVPSWFASSRPSIITDLAESCSWIILTKRTFVFFSTLKIE